MTAQLAEIAAAEALVDGTGADRLVLRLASFEATLHAVRTWHYSGCAPAGKLVRVGVWHGPPDASRFLGVVIFSRGASPWLQRSFGMTQTTMVELTRVALRDHPGVEVSRILVLALRFLRATNPGLRLVASFADPHQGHHGGIYQATNWLYYGTSDETLNYLVHGKKVHVRTVGAWREGHPGAEELPDWLDWLRRYKDPAATLITAAGKHRYLFPFDRATRRTIAHLAQPYPTKESTVEHAGTPGLRSTGSQATREVGSALARFRELAASKGASKDASNGEVARYGTDAAEASRSHAPTFRVGEAGVVPAGRSTTSEPAPAEAAG